MKPHTWVTEVLDSGDYLGSNEFWVCSDCGASGGPVWYRSRNGPTMDPFYAGPRLRLSEDCDEARRQIAAYLETHPPRKAP